MRATPSVLAYLAATFSIINIATSPATAEETPKFVLKYGIISGLTGDSAAAGQAWNEAARLAINYTADTLKRMNLRDISVVLADSQDSQGSPQTGVEVAQKLVKVDGVNVIIGDTFSSVTTAIASSVAIPNKVAIFTGGTSPALTKLNTTQPGYLWQAITADDVQGKVLAQIAGETFGKAAKITIAARNDAYGTNLSTVFKEAWTAKGGTILKTVTYNPQQPLLDSEAREIVADNPDGWLVIDFCQTFAKLALPLIRSGQWDASKTFGSDTLNDCQSKGTRNYPGMRAVQANASSGASFPAFKALYAEKARPGVAFASFTAEAFDSVFVAFLAALQARSSDPSKFVAEVEKITNDPGENYTFEHLDDAIKAVLAGKKIHFNGATGPIAYTPIGRAGASAYDIWQVQADGSSKVIATVPLKP